MNAFYGYDYFTRKQANLLYKSYKQGKIRLTKEQIKEMYNLVGNDNRTFEENANKVMFEDAIHWLVNDNVEFAQAVLDGNHVKFCKVDTVKKIAKKDGIFHKAGDVIEEDVWEYCVV